VTKELKLIFDRGLIRNENQPAIHAIVHQTLFNRWTVWDATPEDPLGKSFACPTKFSVFVPVSPSVIETSFIDSDG
jgi:hypothetical protein